MLVQTASPAETVFAAIPLREASPFVLKYHYSHGHHNGPALSVGMYDGGVLVGVCMFATPCSENVRSAPFGPAEKNRVTELHRLVLLDDCPRNSESRFIAASLRILLEKKPEIRCVLSFADPSAGHVGTIYQATNFIYTGQSSPATFYVDASGRLRHPRQNGHNVTKAEAVALRWAPTKRAGKHRYAIIVGPSHAERKKWRGALRYAPLPYPKNVDR